MTPKEQYEAKRKEQRALREQLTSAEQALAEARARNDQLGIWIWAMAKQAGGEFVVHVETLQRMPPNINLQVDRHPTGDHIVKAL